ncbi:MAG TPA: hypothetical protein PLN36_05235 [Bacteroidales bacterium]|nr:hypothetical protein [Bacteroidales bacterium]
METNKAFEAFENAMIDAMRASIISIERVLIDGDVRVKLFIETDCPCLDIIFEMYREKNG